MAEQPALNRFYVSSYTANDKDFPVLAVRLDPRVAGYRVPGDLTPHPEPNKYPNHVFTGCHPSNGDERVTHVYEILPGPWVPFTRYDDDLGPIQGRRRNVKNEGQKASLASNKKVSYEGREGSAIVLNEIEEEWTINVDEDGNSLFPIKDKDFYDPLKGHVRERRQLFVPSGDEVATLENVDGVITETTYEAYNEYLSVRVVQTYRVDGPRLVGVTTDNDGQLVTVTTQRKAADGYIPPSPSALKTVEASREDAESVIERVIDTPKVFDQKALSNQRSDTVPEKFKFFSPTKRTETTFAKDGVVDGDVVLDSGEYGKSIQRVSEFKVQKAVSSRGDDFETIHSSRLEENWSIQIPYKEYISDSIPALPNIEVDGIGGGQYVIREYDPDEIDEVLSGFLTSIPSATDIDMPRILKDVSISWDESIARGESEYDGTGMAGGWKNISQQDDGEASSSLSLNPKVEVTFEDIWGKNLPASTHIFFLKKENLTRAAILAKTGASDSWPIFKPKSFSTTIFGKTEEKFIRLKIERAMQVNDTVPGYGFAPSKSKSTKTSSSINPVSINIPPCLTPVRNVTAYKKITQPTFSIQLTYQPLTIVAKSATVNLPAVSMTTAVNHELEVNVGFTVPQSGDHTDVPRFGVFLMDAAIEPYKFGYFIVRAVTFDASQLA